MDSIWMGPTNVILFFAGIVVFVSAFFLVFHERYDDGVFGRGSLLGLATGSFVVSGSVLTGSYYSMPNEILLFIISIAVFFGWHAWRFSRRCGFGFTKAQKDERRAGTDRRFLSKTD